MKLVATTLITLILAGVMLVDFGATCACSSKEDAATRFVRDGLKVPLTAYKVHSGDYPSSGEGLAALRTAPPDDTAWWKGLYIEPDAELLDSWGNPYQYRSPGTHNPRSYDCWSRGPDGRDGGGDDIGNWEAGER